jgi:Na+/melibiose symporter-like transporter
MTPEQVARLKGRMYALFGAGIAVLVVAYQFATTPPKEGVIELWVPMMFVAIGMVFFIATAVIWLKVRKQNVEPVTTDLSGPQGKIVILLTVVGFIALIGSYFVSDLAPNDEILGLLMSVGLIAVMIICLLVASRIARKIRSASTTGVDK